MEEEICAKKDEQRVILCSSFIERGGSFVIGDPLIPCGQGRFAVKRSKPLIYACAGPYIHHDLAGS